MEGYFRMTNHRSIRTLLLSSFVVLAVIMTAFFAFSTPTHAASARGNITTSPPFQSNINQKPGKLAHFSPKTLTCVHGTNPCITIKNTTHVTQSVTLNGVVVYTLKHGASQAVTYASPGTFVYSLSSNSLATLTVTVT
jgi:hypothetical protein